MKFGVIRFPGSNCDDDALRVVQEVLRDKGSSGVMVWHKDHLPSDIDILIVPGGFSYGDYLRAGAIAARSPVMADVKQFAERGGPVLGICNGFQVLCETRLLEGALSRNASLKFICKDVYIRVQGKPTPFTSHIAAGEVLRMPIAHAEGRYTHDDPESLQERGMVVFKYASADGQVAGEDNPNGSVDNIAGICNERGNVVGLMPHPERACETILGGTDGRALFESALTSLRELGRN